MENFKKLTLIQLPNFMKQTIWLIALMFLSFTSLAQEKIIVQGTYPNIFIQHKVAPSETLYSIGRLYNFSASQLARQNNMQENDVLSVDKILKIPLNKNNFTQDGQSGENEVLIPLHHIVLQGETLFRISQNFGKIRIDFLREWNDLNNDVIKTDQRIVIGHLKVDKKNVSIVAERIINENSKNNVTAQQENTDEQPTKKQEVKQTETKVTEEETNPTPITNGSDDEGFFVANYVVNNENLAIKTGTAATFKSTSGWTDRKYYVLINDIAPGTIVRLTADNNRSICAKVLGALPEMKENKNLLLRISNAGAAVLGISEKSFPVKVSYPK